MSVVSEQAKARDDQHEFEHIRAAVAAGNSGPCERDGHCRLEATTRETA